MPANNTENTFDFLKDLSQNDQLIAMTYMDMSVYIYFFMSLSLFLFFFFIKTSPFDNPLVKKISLFIISFIGFLLYFKQYAYVGYFIAGIIGLGLYKTRDEIKQYFMIKKYQKQEMEIDLNGLDISDNKIELEDDGDIYEKIGLIQFFNQIFIIFIGMKNIISNKNEVFGKFIFIFLLLSLINLIINAYMIQDLFQTNYIFIK